MLKQVPFNKDGVMLSKTYWCKDVVWKDNYKFEDRLVYDGYGSGRSSIYIYLIGSDGVKYSMFMSEFEKIIREMKEGFIPTRKYTFIQRGQAYSLKAVM